MQYYTDAHASFVQDKIRSDDKVAVQYVHSGGEWKASALDKATTDAIDESSVIAENRKDNIMSCASSSS
jgi:GTP cyclohydrolase III